MNLCLLIFTQSWYEKLKFSIAFEHQSHANSPCYLHKRLMSFKMDWDMHMSNLFFHVLSSSTHVHILALATYHLNVLSWRNLLAINHFECLQMQMTKIQNLLFEHSKVYRWLWSFAFQSLKSIWCLKCILNDELHTQLLFDLSCYGRQRNSYFHKLEVLTSHLMQSLSSWPFDWNALTMRAYLS